MNQELVYRMRTCAAALADNRVVPITETVDLLLEASNLLDEPEPLGEPMVVLPQATVANTVQNATIAQWGSTLLATNPRRCPACGSIDARTVHRNGRRLEITCPRCAHQWDYGT
jgi:DNA-directed RNA polymerase subunit RPC12/RpoP